MFQSARIKLTVWYLVIIMAVSLFFSLAFYNSATQEIQRIINRSRFEQLEREIGLPALRINRPGAPSIEELMAFKSRILLALLSVNSVIFVFAGLSGYFLAGQTLLPIKHMVEEQEHFISDASHELRTPISTLRAEMEGALLEKHITEKQARHLIKSNLEELNSLQLLSDSLLQLTRLHKPKGSKHEDKSLLSEIIRNAVLKVTKNASEKQIKINVSNTESLASVDPIQLSEVLVILLDNAIKYSQEKTHIDINSKKASNHLEISVTDQGSGISSEDVPHIFDRFYRADKSRSQVAGYGLGLAIAHNIITSMRGTLTVISQVGSGSTFTIRIPSV